jgi:cytochrome c oxidase assembly protein subunit 15
MRVPRLRPKTYRAFTFASLVSLAAIVVTGALVRLTDSGLGCSDWPRCSSDKFIDVSSSHAAVEQINRLFTGVVSVAVILAVAGSLIRTPRRRDLTWLSLSLVVGVIGQAVVGGIVVLTDLNPIAVQQHFLLSMVILASAVVLHRRATLLDGERWVRAVEPATMRNVWALAGLAAVALVTGTVTTGTGPHSGIHKGQFVRRFGFEISSVARVHSVTVILTVLCALLLVWRMRGTTDRSRLENAISTVLIVALMQGAVGYLQYFNGVPVVLVAIHVGMATTFWLSIVYLVVATRAVERRDVPASAEAPERPADVVEL